MDFTTVLSQRLSRQERSSNAICPEEEGTLDTSIKTKQGDNSLKR